MSGFNHVASNLQEEKKLVFAAQSSKNFHQRMLICKFVFDEGTVPINPFTNFGYYLYELVPRDVVRNGNNNVLKRCDELWVFGEVSDGVLAEIVVFKNLGKPIRFFDISKLPKEVKEISKEELIFESGVEEHKNLI